MTYLNDYLTYNISPTERIAVYQDEYCHDLADFVGDDLGVFTIAKHSHLRDIEQGDLTAALHDLTDRIARNQYESAIGKYLTLNNCHYKFLDLQGYSQSEWATVVIYSTDPNDLLSDVTVKVWFRGDIYTLAHERLCSFTSTETDRIIESWETIDAIGGVMLDTPEDTISFAKHDFIVTL